MARVTSKLQVTIPKLIAERYDIAPGVDIAWLPAGDAIRVVVQAESHTQADRSGQLELFDAATERQQAREAMRRRTVPQPRGRGWRREDLYRRGNAR